MPTDKIETPTKSAGQIAYEADVAARPFYHDGAPRKSWDELSELARSTWIKNPTPYYVN